MNDRTPAVAKAALSPAGLAVAVAGGAVGVLAGGGVLGGVLLAVMAWGGWVAFTFARRPRAERIDPFTIQEPWRLLVNKAQWTARRFAEAVGRTKAGPLRERLEEVQDRVDAAVREAWEVAKRGHSIDKAARAIDLSSVRAQLAAAEQAGAGPDQEAIVRSLRSQVESAERLAAVAEDARTRLERLNAELDESVARAVELSVSGAHDGALAPLGTDVEGVVHELEALRQALEETGRP